MNSRKLEQEKLLLIRQCEVDRQWMADCLDELEEKTSWAQLAITGASIAAPKLKLLVPVLNYVLPKLLSAKVTGGAVGGVRNFISVVLDTAQKAMTLSKGLSFLPKLLPSKFS